jgi:hypothetical protein
VADESTRPELLERVQEEVERRGKELINGGGANLDPYERPGATVDGANRPMAILRVGVCCEMGCHWSVAFVEELSRWKWPREWVVEIVHRDVDK